MTTNENIQMYQGDTLELEVSGLPTDQDYTAIFAAQDTERNPVGREISINTGGSSIVVFNIEPDLTDLFVVPEDKKSENYYFGVKLCSQTTGAEKTLLLGDAKMGDYDVITVFPRKVKGDE